jgi:hypothetical protein
MSSNSPGNDSTPTVTSILLPSNWFLVGKQLPSLRLHFPGSLQLDGTQWPVLANKTDTPCPWQCFWEDGVHSLHSLSLHTGCSVCRQANKSGSEVCTSTAFWKAIWLYSVQSGICMPCALDTHFWVYFLENLSHRSMSMQKQEGLWAITDGSEGREWPRCYQKRSRG